MKPHKHAELIKAWADGAEIQFKYFGQWRDITNGIPYWSDDDEYRIKPVVKKYRVALMMDGYIGTVNDEKEAKATEFDRCFVRWLTEWMEYQE